jgi:hypothetical protein
MKGLFSKLMVVLAGTMAIFGISAGKVNASVSSPDSSSKSALYLEHGKHIGGNSTIYDHDSHWSHSSHDSHASHYSHSSGY